MYNLYIVQRGMFWFDFTELLGLTIFLFFSLQQNQTPLDLAVAKQNMSLIRLLRKYFGFAPPNKNEETCSDMTIPIQSKPETPPEEEEEWMMPPEMPPKNNIRRGSDQKR